MRKDQGMRPVNVLWIIMTAQIDLPLPRHRDEVVLVDCALKQMPVMVLLQLAERNIGEMYRRLFGFGLSFVKGFFRTPAAVEETGWIGQVHQLVSLRRSHEKLRQLRIVPLTPMELDIHTEPGVGHCEADQAFAVA